jgi:diacylglycerol kinase
MVVILIGEEDHKIQQVILDIISVVVMIVIIIIIIIIIIILIPIPFLPHAPIK